MAIAINGSGTITGITAGGLPDDVITTADIADDAITTAKILNLNVTTAKIATGIDSAKIGAGDVSNTEHAYLNSISSNIQTQVSAAGGFTPGASVYRNSGTQTITTGTVTEVVWQAETYDTDGDFASNGFTVGTGDDGIYIAVAQVYWNSAVIDVEYQIDIAVDGTDVVETMIQMPMSTNQTTDVVGILSLAAAEKVTITIYHDVGSNDTIGNGLRLCQFSIQRIA